MTAKLSCLLIKIPATNSQDPNSMAKFLESVHRILPSGSTISFEIVSRNNILHYFITVVKEYQKYIESQLYANYQDIEITQIVADFRQPLHGRRKAVHAGVGPKTEYARGQ